MKPLALITALAFLILLLAPAAPVAAQTKRIYIAPDDHTNYMWTGDEEAYRGAFVEMIDYYLDLADKTSGNAPEHRSRWHCDGAIWYWTYEHSKTPAEFARLIERTRDGSISLPLNFLVSTHGGTPTEATLRGMYYAGTLERRFGLKIPVAIAMENQTLPYGLGGLWAGAGAKYSWKGVCGCLTKVNRTERRPHEIYWWPGVDGSRILMKWHTLATENQRLGGYAEARQPAREIDFVEQDAAFQKAYPYPVVGIFGKGWDDLKTTTDEFVKVAKEKTTPDRKVIVSNVEDFFADFEHHHGQELPAYAAGFGNEWDLYTASMAEVSARVRRAVEKLRAAEAMATVVSSHRPEFMDGRKAARELAWAYVGMYWEHNWTADGTAISRQQRGEWQRKIAAGIESYVEALHADAAFALGGLIRRGSGDKRFYVFNPLGWARTDAADVPYETAGPVHVVEVATGRQAPSQLVRLPAENFSGTRQYLRIEAKDLPPVGYKVYEVRPGAGENFANAAVATGGTLENSVYKLQIEGRGAISSLIDKTRGNREFAGRSGGQMLINDLGLDPGTLEVENVGPVSATIRARGNGPLTHTSRITLYRDSRRIELRNDIEQNFDGTHHWSFSFNLKSPDVRHEEAGAVIRAKLLADGGHYAPTNSRLEWLTLNHFADMSGEGGEGVTLSNADCIFMKLGNSSISEGVSRLDTKTPQIQVLAGGQIDAPQAGIPKQGGDAHFLQRFALQTHGGYDATAAMKFALEHQNPPVTGWLRSGGILPEASYSYCSVTNPNVLLWALKPAEDGPAAGIVARLWNLTDNPVETRIKFTSGIAAAHRTTHIETDLEPVSPSADGSLSAKFARQQLQTYRVRTTAKGSDKK